MEDNQIVSLFWDRDERAIAETDLKYHSFCFGVAWNLLTNKQDSEECVNDTWFAAWRSIPPKRPLKLPTFLGKITRGYAIDMLRKKYAAKRMDSHIVDIHDEVLELNHAVVNQLEAHMERQDILRILEGFLSGLSNKQHDIFLMRYWSMDSLQEIAQKYHTSEGYIKQNLGRSKAKLQKRLEKEGYL